MKIAVNTRFLLSNKLEGIGMFTHEIFKRVVQLLPEHEFYFIFDRPYSEEFVFQNNVKPIVVAPPARHPFLWYWWFEKSIPKILKENNIDLFISPDGFASLNTSIPQFIVIHDLGFEHYPKHTPFLVQKYYQHFIPKYCQKASKILVVSNFTKHDIIQQYNIEESKIEVVYNGFSNEQNTSAEINLKSDNSFEKLELTTQQYFIFIGAIHPRKNILNLLKAFELHKHSNSTFKLVLVGRNAWMNNEIHLYLSNMKYKTDVVWIEKITRKNLLFLLKNAYALCYPSLFEGFGIPLIEAMNLGVPVITSNVSALPEILGNAGILVSPTSTDEIANAMQQLVNDKKLRQTLIEKGHQQASRFSWDVSAQKIVQLIQNWIEKNENKPK